MNPLKGDASGSAAGGRGVDVLIRPCCVTLEWLTPRRLFSLHFLAFFSPFPLFFPFLFLCIHFTNRNIYRYTFLSRCQLVCSFLPAHCRPV